MEFQTRFKLKCVKLCIYLNHCLTQLMSSVISITSIGSLSKYYTLVEKRLEVCAESILNRSPHLSDQPHRVKKKVDILSFLA